MQPVHPPTPPVHPSTSDHLYTTLTHLSTCPSSVMPKHPHTSSQTLAVMNGNNPAIPVGPLLSLAYFYVV